MSEIPSYDEVVSKYESVIKWCKENGIPRGEAKKRAKFAVFEAGLLGGTFVTENPRFWAAASNILRVNYPAENVQEIEKPKKNGNVVLPFVNEPEAETFMDVVRKMAEIGFIPHGKYLAPLIGERKAGQMPAYISQVCDGKYNKIRNEFGWITTPAETEAEKKVRLLRERVSALINELKLAEKDLSGKN